MAIKRIGILLGGGPAPGSNGVIAAVALEALKLGCTPVGFHDGFEWLAQRYTDEQHELTRDEVSRIHTIGGSILGTSRVDVTRDPNNVGSLENAIAALTKLNIDALITIGGDDLVASSIAIERHSEGRIKVAQVPKSIDNDLWLPSLGEAPLQTLGYETARHYGADIVKSLMADAKTTGRWYLAVTMGRPTGNLTLGIGAAVSATCTVIPEEFGGTQISLSDVADIVEGCVIKRRAMGSNHGVVLLSEALAELFSEKEITEFATVDRDAQGNIRVGEIDLARKVKSAVQKRLDKRGVKVTIVDKTIGYELRSAPPIPYDAEYARDLGFAAVRYIYGGGSGAVITMQGGEFKALPFADVVDHASGRGKQRPVDVTTESYHVARDYMVRLGARDFADEGWVARLAEAGGMPVEEFTGYFGKFAQ
ncbi:MAG: 6-phosphofructokinase [Acidobacteria bacterium]|nr:6-phosphofructokinase [Acidobacteriota bacterium]MBI3427674.1 6-phosphofructokinase [Acidobacteriota bacterium]